MYNDFFEHDPESEKQTNAINAILWVASIAFVLFAYWLIF